MLLHFLRHEWKKKVSTDSDVENKETLSSGISNRNVFPRVRGNQVSYQTTFPLVPKNLKISNRAIFKFSINCVFNF